jgi:autotransporter translocation and assembly factor TamB
MNMADVIALLGVLLPVIAPFVGWGFMRLSAMLPANRRQELSSLAELVVHGVHQQANGGWSNDEKYDAASQALVQLAAKAGYKVSLVEVRMLIESAVLVGKRFGALSSPAEAQPVAPNDEDSTRDPGQDLAEDMPIPEPVAVTPAAMSAGIL